MDLFTLNNKIAVVTGGSRGLGLYMCEAFILSNCAKVFVSSRKENACIEACNHLNKLAKSKNLKGVAIPVAADVSTEVGIKELVLNVQKHTSKIDILVANAGATWGAEFGNHNGDFIDKVMNLNFKGVFLTIQSFFSMLETDNLNDPARVLITGSVAGLRSGMSGGTYGYLASKAAVHHLGKTLAVELGPQNVTVNCLAPGFFKTKMSKGLLNVIGDEMTETNPLGRLGLKEDVYGAVVYLCSKAGSYCNGVVLPVDGGMHLSGRF